MRSQLSWISFDFFVPSAKGRRRDQTVLERNVREKEPLLIHITILHFLVSDFVNSSIQDKCTLIKKHTDELLTRCSF